MQNIGEEIAGEYLKCILGCDFVQYNLYTPDAQGEIDVFGVNLKEKKVFLCEVAIHLVSGLQYVKDKQPDNVDRFIKKFEKGVAYIRKYFTDYEHHLMLWSPIVKHSGENAKHCQSKDVKAIKEYLETKYGCRMELVINDVYQSYLQQLREYARKETAELKSPVLRMMQIEEKLAKHLKQMQKKACT